MPKTAYFEENQEELNLLNKQQDSATNSQRNIWSKNLDSWGVNSSCNICWKFREAYVSFKRRNRVNGVCFAYIALKEGFSLRNPKILAAVWVYIERLGIKACIHSIKALSRVIFVVLEVWIPPHVPWILIPVVFRVLQKSETVWTLSFDSAEEVSIFEVGSVDLVNASANTLVSFFQFWVLLLHIETHKAVHKIFRCYVSRSSLEIRV